jgi:hypothetical protein
MDTAQTPADAGMTWFTVYDTPQNVAAAYPISTVVTIPKYSLGDVTTMAIRFRNEAELAAFRDRYLTYEVVVQ